MVKTNREVEGKFRRVSRDEEMPAVLAVNTDPPTTEGRVRRAT